MPRQKVGYADSVDGSDYVCPPSPQLSCGQGTLYHDSRATTQHSPVVLLAKHDNITNLKTCEIGTCSTSALYHPAGAEFIDHECILQHL